MGVLGEAQLRALALFSLRLHATGYGIGLVFFRAHLLILGYLVSRAGFLPRVLGWLLVAAGAGYLFNSFAGIVAPAIAKLCFPWSLLPGFVAELGLTLWFLAVGLDPRKWEERATTTVA